MTRFNLLRLLRPVFAAFAITMMTVAGTWAAPPPAHGVRATPIGTPTWQPVDFHLFSAPVGTAATGYAEFGDTALGLLPPPEHVFHPALLVGPGSPHAPPYDAEIAAGVAANGYHEGVRFRTAEFSNGEGIWLVWMNVPAPGSIGSSPDFASGPIIPNSVFPITFSSISYHNGKEFNPFLGAGSVPPLDDSIDPPFSVDGHSHFPFFIADNADFGPVGAKLRGSYRFVITMVDATGSGWLIEAHFAVAP